MIHLTPKRLRALVRAAYEDGFEDGVEAAEEQDEVVLDDAHWKETVTADNLEQDLVKAQKQGGKYP